MLRPSSRLLDDLRAVRTVWIGGRMRGGKTSLAYYLAMSLSEAYGYQITGNIASVFKARGDLRRSVVVMDEAGTLDVSPRKLQVGLGKLDIIMLYPSVVRPDRDMCKMSIRYILSMRDVFPWLTPWAIYSVEFPDMGRQSRYFVRLDASASWGCYDSSALPLDDGGFVRRLEELARRIKSDWSVI